MALTEAQVETVREITGERSFTAVSGLCAALNASQEAATVLDIAEWQAVKSKYLKITGGKSGVDLDFDRNREAIRDRVRTRLDLPDWYSLSDPDAVVSLTLCGGSWL